MPADTRLHPSLSYCCHSGTLVFLDAARDRYFCLKDDQAGLFREIARTQAGESLPPKVSAFRDELILSGIFTKAQGAGNVIAPCAHPAPTASVFDATTRPRATLRDTARFLSAWAACAPFQRNRKIQSLLDTARQWRAPLPPCESPDEACRLAGTFHALAPYFITLHDACLFRSYLLIRYLASAGVAADWIFGIRLSPFAAHCWVEQDGHVLNEHLDTVQEFQPILCA